LSPTGTGREKICATGIYYFDNDNVTTPTLSFRAAVGEDIENYGVMEHGQDEYGHVSIVSDPASEIALRSMS